MKRNKTISMVIAAIAVIGLAGAAIYTFTNDKKENANNNKSSTADSSMAGMDHSMDSMNKELEGLQGDAFDEKFLTLMTEHHAGAVDMAQYTKDDAKHQEIRTLSRAIISDQNSEISQMSTWAKQWGYKFSEPDQKAVTAMSETLKGKSGDDLDKQFITDMSIHHNGAIEMAQLALTNAKHQELKDFAQKIIDAQTKEISDMMTWAANWGYQLEDNPNNPHESMSH